MLFLKFFIRVFLLGDSIAMAVSNANFKIPSDKDAITRPKYMVDLVNCLIVCEDFKRESLNNVLALIKENYKVETSSTIGDVHIV